MPKPISIESSTMRENRISFFEHRNKIIGKLLWLKNQSIAQFMNVQWRYGFVVHRRDSQQCQFIAANSSFYKRLLVPIVDAIIVAIFLHARVRRFGEAQYNHLGSGFIFNRSTLGNLSTVFGLFRQLERKGFPMKCNFCCQQFILIYELYFSHNISITYRLPILRAF